jgi:hypothetical protein
MLEILFPARMLKKPAFGWSLAMKTAVDRRARRYDKGQRPRAQKICRECAVLGASQPQSLVSEHIRQESSACKPQK